MSTTKTQEQYVAAFAGGEDVWFGMFERDQIERLNAVGMQLWHPIPPNAVALTDRPVQPRNETTP